MKMSSIIQLEIQLRKTIGSRREPTTVDQYCAHLRRLIGFTGKAEWTRDNLLSYFEKLISDGASPNYISTTFHILRSASKMLEIEFPLTALDLPRGRVRPVHQYSVSVDDLAEVIEYVKEKGDYREKLLLSVSTVYGLRRIEMARLTDKSFSGSTMSVETAKHGEPRTHLIPDILEEWIRPDLCSLPIEPTEVSLTWKRICEKAGYDVRNGEGWHAIRRTLVTQLVKAGNATTDVENFMRWSKDNSKMVSRYFQADDGLEVDERIFRKHPLLELW